MRGAKSIRLRLIISRLNSSRILSHFTRHIGRLSNPPRKPLLLPNRSHFHLVFVITHLGPRCHSTTSIRPLPSVAGPSSHVGHPRTYAFTCKLANERFSSDVQHEVLTRCSTIGTRATVPVSSSGRAPRFSRPVSSSSNAATELTHPARLHIHPEAPLSRNIVMGEAEHCFR